MKIYDVSTPEWSFFVVAACRDSAIKKVRGWYRRNGITRPPNTKFKVVIANFDDEGVIAI